MIFAPVVIPTLNRATHLKRCIDSLKNNSYAKYTDLYVSVDYPPSDRYIEGHKKVTDYLEKEEESLKEYFSDVHIYYQEKNLGAYLNGPFIRDIVEKSGKYEGYIFTEDDNEFAPCFLEYIDKGLEKYKNDDSVMVIASTASNVCIDNNLYNAYKTISSSAWGAGKWFKKEAEYRANFNRQLFVNISKSFKTMHKIFKISPDLFIAFYNTLLWKGSTYVLEDGSPRDIDMNRFIYNIVNEKCIIRPTVAKTRNWGMDGSGINSGNSGVSALKQKLSEEISFDYRISEDIYYTKTNKRTITEYIVFFKRLSRIYLYRIIGEKNYKKLDLDMLGAKINHKIYKFKSVFKSKNK